MGSTAALATPAYAPLSVCNFPHSRTYPPSPPPAPAPLDSYWTANFYSSLTHCNANAALREEAEIVVIGSGLTGSVAAAELVDKLLKEPVRDEHERVKTTRIVVLEARTFSSGATGRNGGHLTAYPIAHFNALADKYGSEDAKRAVEMEDEAIRWLLGEVHAEGWEEDVDLQEGGGTLSLYDSPVQLETVKSSLSAAARAGLDPSKARFVSPEEVKEKWGAVCEGAFMVPGNNLYPLKFVTKLFQRAVRRASSASTAAKESGELAPVELELYTHCLVDTVAEADCAGKAWMVQTARGAIRTNHVLHATNAYLSSVLPSYAHSPSFPGIIPTRGQVMSFLPTAPSSPSSPLHSWTNAFSPTSASPGSGVNTYAFLRRWSAEGAERGEIIIGGMREHCKGWEWGVTDDTEVSSEVGNALRESVGKTWLGVFKLVEEGEVGMRVKERLQVQREWTGVMGYREDGNPMVGAVYLGGKKQEGQWISAGYSGHGMPRAPPCARLVGSLIHRHLVPSSSPFRLPPYFPRHLLATPDGHGRSETVLAEEAKPQKRSGKEAEKGWVWVARREGKKAQL
ncbi:hypothetical protein JCM10213_003824 [Rhodosporidiobolus nylandii]